MKTKTKLILLFLLILAGFFWWRRGRGIHRHPIPCPPWFTCGLENPYVQTVAGSALLLDRLSLQPGMKVLDVGSGPGRLSIPAAERVGTSGQVTALDIQPEMLDKLIKRAREKGVGNIQTVLGGIGEGLLKEDAFDRALLVTVLGEITNRKAALEEIYSALKPGGILSITEIIPDPHYQSRDMVRSLAEAAGFHLQRQYGGWLAFTMNFEKPIV